MTTRAAPARTEPAPPADDAVRKRVIHELDTSFFLEAGAGTGKTSVLVGRVVELVRRGAASLHEVVAITFTEKAAGELRDRIRRQLHAAHATADGEEADNLRRAVRQVDGAHIETIHAFAASLLRERPLDTGIDPVFSVLDAVGEQLAFEEAWEGWLWSENGAGRAAIERCLQLGLRLAQLRELALQMTEFRDLRPPPPTAPPPDAEETRRAWLEQAQRLLPLAEAASTGVATEIRELLETLRAAADQPGAALDVRLATLPRTPERRRRRAGEALIRFQEAAEAFAGERDRYARALRSHALSEAIHTIREFVEAGAQQRRNAGTLSFQDLLIEARDLLVGNPRARAYFRRRYKALLVDEFQDTDPLQAEIVMILAADQDAADWHSARPAPGRLMVVGDPKQSIYRFRRADIDAYADVQARFAARAAEAPDEVQVDALEVNFRSRPELVGWHNQVFAALIRRIPDYANAQPDYLPLTPHRREPGPGVIALQPNAGAEWRRIGEARLDEAQAVARFIQTVVKTEELPVLLPAGDTARTPTYRDVCLLVRSRTALELYTDALDAAGVPYHLDTGRGFFVQQEIRDAAAILTALDDPSDEVAVVAALKAAPYAASDSELLEYSFTRTAPRPRFVLERGELPAEYDGPLRPLLEELISLREALRDESLPAFVELVLRTTHLAEIQLGRANGAQRAANLQLLVQRAADFAANEVDSLRPFVRWVADQTRTDLAEAESPVTEIDDDVVRILTFHQAKGLEFPVVILPKLAGGERRDRPVAVVDRVAGRVDFEIGPEEARFASAGFAEGQQRERRYGEAEERRLFYVAATRARDYLVLPRFFTSRSPGVHALLDEALAGWLDPHDEPEAPGMTTYRLAQLAHVRAEEPPPPAVAAREFRERWRAHKQQALDAGRPRVRAIAPSQQGHDAVKLARETEPPDRAAEVDVLDEAGAAPPADEAPGAAAPPGGDVTDARVRGTAIHDALAIAVFDDWPETERRARALCLERGLESIADGIVDDVRHAFFSALLERARAAQRDERELPLVVFQRSEGEDLEIREGFVDYLFQESDGWVLLDYKSDRDPTPEVISGYEEQVRLYAEMFRATGEPLKEAHLLFTRDGSAHQVPIEAEPAAPATPTPDR